ncbi:MAG: hypothetical protein IPL34_00455 [Thiofilum sp.]|nr:hypothetical protein [Thiofilum sp.]
MGAEKVEAFGEAWLAMSMQMWKVNQEWMRMWFNAFTAYPLSQGGSLNHSTKRLESATLNVLSKGMTPVHKRVVSNAKRLTRS